MIKVLQKHLTLDICATIILANITIYYLIELYSTVNNYEFYPGKSHITNINLILALFSHKDVFHLIANIFTFYPNAKDLIYSYDKNSRSFMNSWKFFLFLYIISGVVGIFFEITILQFLNYQWRSEVEEVESAYSNKNGSNCTNFFCSYFYQNTGKVAGYFYSLWNYDKYSRLHRLQNETVIIGAESSIYGVLGAVIAMRLFSRNEEGNIFKQSSSVYKEIKKLYKEKRYFATLFELVMYFNDLFSFITLIFDVLSKFIIVPWNINSILNIILSDQINTSCHLGGALAGILITILYIRKYKK